MANQHVQDLMGHLLNDWVERRTTEQRLEAILFAYRRAKEDENTKLPSYFMAALEAALQSQ